MNRGEKFATIIFAITFVIAIVTGIACVASGLGRVLIQ